MNSFKSIFDRPVIKSGGIVWFFILVWSGSFRRLGVHIVARMKGTFCQQSIQITSGAPSLTASSSMPAPACVCQTQF
eukprot:5422593-Amphidinium_carterae.1